MARPSPDKPWIAPHRAGPDGLVGVGGDLEPATLLRAYGEGVFPWFSPGDPILWWSPDPRAIIELDGLHVSRSLARTIRSGKFEVTANADFAGVVRGCADRGADEGTWITRSMIEAYEQLHRLGRAHSIETWIRDADGNRVLAGGIYGVAIGALFAGESMFHRETDASKVALAALVDRLRQRGYELFDVQMRTDHTTRMGAVEIPRSEYLGRLAAATARKQIAFA